jgi:hypothetical protein
MEINQAISAEILDDNRPNAILTGQRDELIGCPGCSKTIKGAGKIFQMSENNATIVCVKAEQRANARADGGRQMNPGITLSRSR